MHLTFTVGACRTPLLCLMPLFMCFTVCCLNVFLFTDYVPRSTEDVVALREAQHKKEEIRQANRASLSQSLCVNALSVSVHLTH